MCIQVPKVTSEQSVFVFDRLSASCNIYTRIYQFAPSGSLSAHSLGVGPDTDTNQKKIANRSTYTPKCQYKTFPTGARSLSSRLVTSPRRMQCNIMYLLSRRLLLASTIQYTNVTLYQFPPLSFHCRIFSTPYALSLSFKWWWCVFTFLKHTF